MVRTRFVPGFGRPTRALEIYQEYRPKSKRMFALKWEMGKAQVRAMEVLLKWGPNVEENVG